MSKRSGSRPPDSSSQSGDRLDAIVARARREHDERHRGYRELSLKIHPWVCARCGREFTRENLHLLTVHHKDHDHDNNPLDGSNWENLCIYCHDNEHSRYLDHQAGAGEVRRDKAKGSTHKALAGLKDLLKDK